MRKFYLKTLFLACTMLMSVSSVWGLNEDIIETYDFENWGKAHMNKNSRIDRNGTVDAGFKVNGVNMYYLNIVGTKDSQEWDLSNRFAVSDNVCYRWPSGSSDVPRLGNEYQSGDRYISIIGLKEGDRVSFIASNVKIYSNNATYLEEETTTDVVSGTTITSNTVYTIKGEGWQHLDLIIASSTWGNITKVVITRNVEFEAVSSKSWDFKNASWDNNTGFGTSTIKVNNMTCTYASGVLEGIALQGANWIVNGNGLTQGNGDRNIGVLDLKAQDLVIVTGTVAISHEVNATNTNDATPETYKYRINSDGVFGFTIDRNKYLKTITVYRQVLPPVSDGDYYLKNKATGAYFAAGKAWGTQAITNDLGHYVTLNIQPSGKYYIDTHITGNSHYLTQGLWVDNTADEFTFADAGDGYYTISYGDNKVTAAASGEILTLTSGTDDYTKWELLTPTEWKAENVARLDAATASSGVDATFYITAPNFNRNDDLNSAWQGNPSIVPYTSSAGLDENFNAEKYNTTPFDVYQELTGLKPGAYKLTVDGFYRNGTTNDRNAQLYANDYSTTLLNIKSAGITTQDNDKGFTVENDGYYVPNTQKDAALAFNNGYYNNELFFVVGNDGSLRIGVKKDTGATNDWAVFDNFQLTYYGNTVSATIGSTGWTTFASPYALDLSGISASEGEATAYYASAAYASYVTMTSTAQNVEAGTGLMLKGTNGATVTIPVISSGTAIYSNLLVGCTTSTVLSANSNYYVLVNNGGTAEFQCLDTNGATIPAGKAYLNVPSAGASLRISFEADETTGINAVEGTESTNGIYNLNGQRIMTPTKGLYIIDGKKVFIK